jgi:membrane protease subunit HflK
MRALHSTAARLLARLPGLRAQQDGPPDLDELWRDFKRKLGHLMPGGPQGPNGPNGGNGSRPGGGGSPDNLKAAGAGLGLAVAIIALAWLGSGFFIVQEGSQAVVTSFGRYSKTVEAGIQWRLPYPFQGHETVQFSQVRTREIGNTSVDASTGLRDSSMLTRDENIVDIRFSVQYRLKDSRDYLFENNRADFAVDQAAETAVREIVGRSTMDSVLYEQRDALANDLVKSIQTQLDTLKAGVQVVNVNVSGVQAPEQVQAAFDDAVRAGADRERAKNEGEAYANQVIPAAKGTAARLLQEAEGHKARVVSVAEGDTQRFRSVLAEYQKAPAVTRDRLYTETMQQVYANVSKVMVDAKTGSNLLYLPLDKLMQAAGAPAPAPAPAAAAPEAPTPTPVTTVDPRSRDGARSRDRESR